MKYDTVLNKILYESFPLSTISTKFLLKNLSFFNPDFLEKKIVKETYFNKQ